MSFSAFGVLVKRGNGAATEVFTSVSKVRDSNGPEYSLDTINVTNNDSTGGWEEVAPTILRSGSFTFNALHDPRNATQSTAGIKGDMQSKRLVNWRVYLPPATATGYDKLAFAGYVTGINQGQPFEGAKTIDVTVKPTGTVTWSTTDTATE